MWQVRTDLLDINVHGCQRLEVLAELMLWRGGERSHREIVYIYKE